MENYTKRIEEQEKKDRFVADKVMKDIFHTCFVTTVPYGIQDWVDVQCTLNTLNTDAVKTFETTIEIKERNKNEWQLKNYPHAELKVEKYNRMRKSTPKGSTLLYMVLLNQKYALLFDLDRLDWNKVEKRDWTIKRTQMNPNSDWVTYPTFFIPYKMAKKIVRCDKYFEEYN